MKSSTSAAFRKQLADLAPDVQRLARNHRALGMESWGTIVWFFIGRHDG
jgi:hypothetical protein